MKQTGTTRLIVKPGELLARGETDRERVKAMTEGEQRRTTPDAPARALLRAIEREPETMRRRLARLA